MAYEISLTWKEPQRWYFQYRDNAIKMFNIILKKYKLDCISHISVPYRITLAEWERLQLQQITWSDASNEKFLFLDNENNWLLVLWDRYTFWEEYVRLTKKYQKRNLEYSTFYDELEDNLKPKWVGVIWDIKIIRENDLNWSD